MVDCFIWEDLAHEVFATKGKDREQDINFTEERLEIMVSLGLF